MDTYCFGLPLLFLCVCFTRCVFIHPYTMVSTISAMNYTNCCCRKGNLPALVCSKTRHSEVLGGLQQWSIRKLCWTKAAFSGKLPPRSHLPQSCTRPVPAQWTSQWSAFSEYLWEKLSQKQSTFFGSFLHLPPLPINKPQMFSGIPQTLQHYLSLTTSLNINHPNICTLTPNSSLLIFSRFLRSLQVFCILNANRPLFMVHAPTSCPQDSVSHSLHLRSCSPRVGLLKPCSGERHSRSKHRYM